MGFFDRFKSKQDRIGEDKKPKHVVDADKQKVAKKKEQEKQEKAALKKQFQAVPAAGKEGQEKAEKPKEDDDKKSKGKEKKQKKGPVETGDAHRILMHPIVSEKGAILGSMNQYIFAVNPLANKAQVKDAVRRVYGVTPQRVRVMNIRGRKVRHGRTEGTTKRWKKAYVTLKAGETIELVEGV